VAWPSACSIGNATVYIHLLRSPLARLGPCSTVKHALLSTSSTKLRSRLVKAGLNLRGDARCWQEPANPTWSDRLAGTTLLLPLHQGWKRGGDPRVSRNSGLSRTRGRSSADPAQAGVLAILILNQSRRCPQCRKVPATVAEMLAMRPRRTRLTISKQPMALHRTAIPAGCVEGRLYREPSVARSSHREVGPCQVPPSVHDRTSHQDRPNL